MALWRELGSNRRVLVPIALLVVILLAILFSYSH